MSNPIVAYSYIRFSTPEQHKGDSIRRQTALAAAYCLRKGWDLDATLKLQDFGISAWKGQNAKQGELSGFLKAIDQGKVRPCSALIVESVDRISRQGIDEGYDLCKRILKAGVHIITLSPERDFGPETVKGLTKGALELQIILERAEEESRIKSERVTAAWVSKRTKAREQGTLLTSRLPLWLEERDGKPVLIPERAEIVRHIFHLATNGYGFASIVKRFTQDNVPAFGKSGHWARSVIAAILKDRRALGEYQYRKRRGGHQNRVEEPPIANYYPSVVTEEEWYAARAGAAQRRQKPGRISRTHINVFNGLIFDAMDGGTYCADIRTDGKHKDLLVNSSAIEGRSRWRSFPFHTFERGILGMLREIDQSELTDQPDNSQEVDSLTGELYDISVVSDKLEQELLTGDIPAIARQLRRLEERKKEVEEKLISAKDRQEHPAIQNWMETRSLLSLIDNAPDQEDIRLRLRALLRRTIDSIWLLVTSRGMQRLASVQVWFQGAEKFRQYRILHVPPKANKCSKKDGRWWVESIRYYKTDTVIDLRNPKDAERELKNLQHFKMPEDEVDDKRFVRTEVIPALQ